MKKKKACSGPADVNKGIRGRKEERCEVKKKK
jgi:hypothetical protein